MLVSRLDHTYVAAIQNDLVDLEGATAVGVVRKPTPWFYGAVDLNKPALGPPVDLLDEFKDRHEDLKMRGLCDKEAHNTAWKETNLEKRYLDYLEDSGEAQEATDVVVNLLEQHEDVYLVCYENTENKKCHRVPLKQWIESRV